MSGPPGGAERVPWLDGVRGVAALFVVLHHIWLTSWPGFPSNTGPWWLGWLLYGHMAVAVFIVVSGFSLGLAPMRNGWRLSGSPRSFFRRRAWRILPPYWAALILSTVLAAVFLQPEVGARGYGEAFAVHGLLLQDVVGTATPNGALWSIAVEWQIYFLFPLLLILGRRFGLAYAVAVAAVVVLAAHALASVGGPFEGIDHLTPQFLVLFALGVLSVQLGHRSRGTASRGPLRIVAAASLGGFVILALAEGSEWMVAHFFWVDLLFGVGVAALLALGHAGEGGRVRGAFAARSILWLGLFSYSIYLVHDPIVGMLNEYVFGPLDLSPLATFGLTLVAGLPVILALSYGFHLLFEAPFVRHRDLGALREMWPLRVGRRREPVVEADARTATFPPPLPAGEQTPV